MILHSYRTLTLGAVAIILSGCATVRPTGPSVSVMPAPGKPFEVFASEDQLCRQFAEKSIGLPPGSTTTNTFAASALTGTAIGAAAGALMGGHEGASVGAGMGLVAGTAAGANQAEYSSRDAQWRYDNAYMQCMYAKGNQIPGYRYSYPQIPPPPPNNSYGSTPYPPPPPVHYED